MKTKILLIDDDDLVLRTIEKLLTKQGYELTVVDNGQEAVKLSKDGFFDLIIADVRMPGMDGLETLERIKKPQEAVVSKSKFILITGYSDPKVSDQAAKMGIKYFLMKPFDRDLFIDTLGKCLAKTTPSLNASSPRLNEILIDNFIKEQQEKNEQLISKKSKPIIGWTNTYVPEEIIMAAGCLPFRISGAPISLNLSKSYLSGNLCSSVQSILECALNGDYKFLDGIIIGGSTDATKRLYDAWTRYVDSRFCRLFDIPKFVAEDTYTHYMESIRSLIEAFEKYFKIKISDSEIREAIVICNKTRMLLTGLSNLRKTGNPPISSRQFLEVCKLAMICDKNDFNNSLETVILKIKPEAEKKQAYRLLLSGSFQDQSWLLNIIEETGGMVVCEDFCTRLRYFSGLVEENNDAIRALVKRYLEIKPASANLISFDRRAGYLLKIINEFDIDGVIYYILKFDDAYLFEYPDMKDYLAANNIPVLRIETEHNTSAMGQIMTRVQAFIETLRLTKLQKR